MTNPDEVAAGRPVLLRGGTVLTMDDAHTILADADVLVTGDRIAAVGPRLEAPDGALEIDASGGIVMPGMIDTHRHMWQTAMRAYGADWTLTQYFVWNYLEHGRKFRPEDIAAGNSVSAWEALEAGVTTSVDWSHNLHTPEHAEAAVDALRAVPGRFVLAYGNIQAGPWEWTADPALRSFFDRHTADDMLGFQIAFDVTGDPAFPEKAAFEVARELGLAVTTHAGVWGATNDDGIRLMHENGFMTPETIYVHAATLSTDSYQRIAATGGTISVSTESEQSAGQGYPPTWQVRRHGIPVALSMDTSVWWSGDLFSAMRATLSADRAREHLEAHARDETVTNHKLRAERVVSWATRGGAHTLGLDGVVGVLTLYHSAKDAFSRDHLRILLAVTHKVALSIENALRYRQAETSAVTDALTQEARLGCAKTCALMKYCLCSARRTKADRRGSLSEIRSTPHLPLRGERRTCASVRIVGNCCANRKRFRQYPRQEAKTFANLCAL